MSYNETLKQTRPIASAFIQGDNQNWQDVLEKILVELASNNIQPDESTFESILRDIRATAQQTVAPAVDENIWEILSEHQSFDEQQWQAVSDRFQIALETFLTQHAERIADSIVEKVVDDIQYTKSKTRYFGHSDNDF
jgi:uncharacterized membrane protein YheB (UPF0754 family)